MWGRALRNSSSVSSLPWMWEILTELLAELASDNSAAIRTWESITVTYCCTAKNGAGWVKPIAKTELVL